MCIKLSQTPLFRGIEEQEITPLLGCLGAAEKNYMKGETILSEGETTEQMGVVLSGRVLIECRDVWGNNSILGSAGPGAVFGEAYACVPKEPLLISASAAEDTRVLFVSVGRMLSHCQGTCPYYTVLVSNLLTVCANRSLELSRRILHTTSKTIRGRLQSYFSQCVKQAGSFEFEVPFNRQQLADYLSVDRSAMCAELSKMQKDGLIRYEKNHFAVRPEMAEEV